MRNDIKKQIQEAINVNCDFAGNIRDDKFRYFANEFINATTYGQSERFARQFINFILHQHGKGIVGPTLESLNSFELYGEYEYGKQRLHFIHQANVFLLGLFLYHEVPIIREKLDEEIDLTTSEKEIDLTTSEKEIDIDGFPKHYRYSGNSKFEEFLYRWKLASLCHDIGYGISLSGNDENKINKILKGLYSTEISNLNNLWRFEGKNLLSQLDFSISEISIKNYMRNQYNNPFKGSVYYDHGLISSLIFLRLMNQEYASHRNNIITSVDNADIIWHETFLSESILQVAIAIAFHNLDQYSDLLQKIDIAENKKIFDLEKRPLSWLLKISDIIQEWDKPEANEKVMNKKIKPPSIQISFVNDKLIVKKFPKKKLKNVQQTILNYTNSSDLIGFIVNGTDSL